MCGDVRETEIRMVVMTPQGGFRVFRNLVDKRQANDPPGGDLCLAEEANKVRMNERMDE